MKINLHDIVPQTIYKYREIDNEEHLRIITHQEIYFAKPSEFLDPYDCRYKIDREYIKNEQNRREFYANTYGILDLNDPFINYLLNQNPITDGLIDKAEENRRAINDSMFGVFSASTNYQNNHLWKEFGGNHKGFCVGLEFSEIFPLNEGIKGKVDYVEIDELPVSKVINYSDFNESIRYSFDLILTLPIQYISEQEYRIQKFIMGGEPRRIKIKKEHIKSIILGYKMTKNQREYITNLIETNLPHAKIKRLKYQKGHYKEIELN